MKSVVTSFNEIKPEYPCLKKGPNNCIVLFEGVNHGTIVAVGKSNERLGRYYSNWPMSHFFPFSGSVTLNSD